jgi:hypothetical protein
MKYFTKEMWLGWQEQVPAGQEKAAFERQNRDWRRRVTAYNRQLQRLRTRLDRETFRFFANVSTHDGTVVTVQVIEEAGVAIRKYGRRRKAPDRVEVRLEVVPFVSLGFKPRAYVLRYRQVRRLVVDFPSDQPMFWAPGRGLGDWGYDELSAAGREYLWHEVLFASGSTLLIESKSVTARKAKPE